MTSSSAQRGQARDSSPLRDLAKARIFWPLVTLALLLLFNLVTNPQFFSITMRDGHLYGSLIDILNRASPLMIIAMGLTLVIATHGIDISVGAVVAISGAVAATMIGGQLVLEGGMQNVTLYPLPAVIAVSLAVAMLLGMWNGLLVSYFGMQPIIATLILLVTGRGLAQLITGGQIITIYYSPYSFIGNGFLAGIPFSLFIVAAVLSVLLLLTRKTALGLFIEAIGINPVAARFSGVRARAITFWVYAFCGLCAGIAGLIVSSNVKSADGNNAGLLFELDAILAVVLGGTSLGGGRFTLTGGVLGALIIQTLTTTIYAAGVAPEVTLVVKAGVVFLVSILQSDKVRNRLTSLGKAREALS
ncbi:ABC transporter permease [Stigmatella aurantiaca]|uniref:ABC transporter, membrane spanning protein (Ribose) n=1 Tax=Stigmatella aurantiaca (strain DW4/3-1) TaxID=378806 RepID=Q08PR2_STIAD|nr:ABC transporter permease [Stigmatella aurantiaca]ADO69721.1 ABC transporter, membrane spanning protein (Ribose) [Stigmatella aurantiaca DW4/3-1]EAU62476.1 ABC transporter, membrane spanning protein (ribose) [Stigmatella aurantiaca DW4/3-1]